MTVDRKPLGYTRYGWERGDLGVSLCRFKCLDFTHGINTQFPFFPHQPYPVTWDWEPSGSPDKRETLTCHHGKGASFYSVPRVDRSFNCLFSIAFLFFLQGCHSFKRLYIVIWPLSVHQSRPTDRLPFPRHSSHSGWLWCLSRAISISTRPPIISRSCNGRSRVPTRPPLREQCFRERFTSNFNVLL